MMVKCSICSNEAIVIKEVEEIEFKGLNFRSLRFQSRCEECDLDFLTSEQLNGNVERFKMAYFKAKLASTM